MRKDTLLAGLSTILLLASMLPAAARAADNRVLEFDFPEMRIGVAEYEGGPTGTTVFYFPKGVMGAADVRGGSPGTVNAHAVELGYEDHFVDAVVFSGGSWYGLSAATGVANAIKDARQKAGDFDHVAGVLGGIIYDVGARRFSRITPDDQLGRQAFAAAEPDRFALGAHGAGRFAMQGYYFVEGQSADAFARWPHSGQGGAFQEIGPTRVAVFTVVNALGTIVDRAGHVVRCHRNLPQTDCPPIADLLAARRQQLAERQPASGGPTGNTTLTLVVTNQKLPFAMLQRLAVQVHTSMARAIQPFSTEADGDVLYAVTTGEVDNPGLSPMDLGVVASELAWDAILSSVPELPTAPQSPAPGLAKKHLQVLAGTYEFPGGGRLTVQQQQGGLVARFAGDGRSYFDEGRAYRLMPAGGTSFIVDAPARDVLHFEVARHRVTGLTLNPGPWHLAARRTAERSE